MQKGDLWVNSYVEPNGKLSVQSKSQLQSYRAAYNADSRVNIQNYLNPLTSQPASYKYAIEGTGLKLFVKSSDSKNNQNLDFSVLTESESECRKSGGNKNCWDLALNLYNLPAEVSLEDEKLVMTLQASVEKISVSLGYLEGQACYSILIGNHSIHTRIQDDKEIIDLHPLFSKKLSSELSRLMSEAGLTTLLGHNTK